MSNDNNDIPPLPPEGGGGGGGEDRGVLLDSGRPSVASAPGKMTVVLILAALAVAFVIKELFFSGGGKPAGPPHNIPVRPANESGLNHGPVEAPIVTVPPPMVQAPPPPPPPPNLNTPIMKLKAPNDDAERARIRSPMLVGSSGVGKLFGEKKKAPPTEGSDPNSAFAQNVVDTSEADSATATRIGNLNTTIAQGKFIQAILETAINTDLPGPIRAVVSHDTYAESGKNVLIPKGSRLIGVYNPSVRRGQSRVFIIWTRVIRPDGVDIMVNSPGVDTLGRAGLAGDVDNKYFQMFSTALLTSTLDIGVAAAGQGLFGNQQSTTVSGGNGTATTVESPTAAAMQQAVGNIGAVGASIVNSTLNLAPVITVDQGTPINVFVNRDLSFPTSVTGMSQFVQ